MDKLDDMLYVALMIIMLIFTSFLLVLVGIISMFSSFIHIVKGRLHAKNKR